LSSSTRPARRRLPQERASRTISFTVDGVEGYPQPGEYEDCKLGEFFVQMGKERSARHSHDTTCVRVPVAVLTADLLEGPPR